MITDSGIAKDATQPVEGGGDDDGGMCRLSAAEACNLRDDDCDGKTDEETEAVCEGIIANGRAECVALSGAARCVLRRCNDGYSNCDGDPTNGCEDPYCMCHDCPLDDAGEPIPPDDDGGGQVQ